MNQPLLFMTGNKRKIDEAQHVCDQYGIALRMRDNDIDEIQHSDPAEVTAAKARAAYAMAQEPVVVQDTSWSIPALNGFPGAYMKDVTTWLTVDDWLHMMQRHSDATIHGLEYVGYCDVNGARIFSHTLEGKFIRSPKGKGRHSFERVVKLKGAEVTLAEAVDSSLFSIGDYGMRNWHEFAKWYTQT